MDRETAQSRLNGIRMRKKTILSNIESLKGGINEFPETYKQFHQEYNSMLTDMDKKEKEYEDFLKKVTVFS